MAPKVLRRDNVYLIRNLSTASPTAIEEDLLDVSKNQDESSIEKRAQSTQVKKTEVHANLVE